MMFFDEYIMLSQRIHKKDVFCGYWAAVGGKVETNECVIRAMKREMKEESGLICYTDELHLIDAFHVPEIQTKCFIFAASFPKYRFSDVMNTEPRKHSPWQLFTREEARKLKLMPLLQQLV